MRSETHRVVLPVACEIAFEFLADYRNDVLWRDELTHVRLKDGVAGEADGVYEGTVDWNGLTARHELRVLGCERPRWIHVQSVSPNLTIDVVYRLAERDQGCVVEIDYTLVMEGPMLILEPFGWAVFMGWVKDDLPRLPEALDRVSRSGR